MLALGSKYLPPIDLGRSAGRRKPAEPAPYGFQTRSHNENVSNNLHRGQTRRATERVLTWGKLRTYDPPLALCTYENTDE